MMTYSIDLSQGITESLFQTLHQIVEQKFVATKRLTEVTIEILQNIKKHRVNSIYSRLVIHKQESGYLINATNTLHTKDVSSVTKTLNVLNSLSRTQIKELYTQTLKHATFSEKQGAGLGLYRIAMRSVSMLKFSFTKLDQQYSIFSLSVTISA